MNQPVVKVGILSFATKLEIVLHGCYTAAGKEYSGAQTIVFDNGAIVFDGRRFDDVLDFKRSDEKSTFEIKDVVIGVNFHWERKEDQTFTGDLSVKVTGPEAAAINVVPVEDYLMSVISSEMSATASLELLKAHAVISRSWLLAQIYKKDKNRCDSHIQEGTDGAEYIKWYDREDHEHFDVCADDHCQRYQGITRQSTPKVVEAVKATWGRVLTYGGEICDARFSKCCGGVFEEFENCWEPEHHHYLEARRDDKDENDFPDLRDEAKASEWINSRPDAFCNTADAEILSQVLNNYDQETTDFYRWQIHYGREELSALAKERSGIDFGQIIDLIPVERGTSGRIVRLKIIGTNRTLTIGKELEIRRTLSKSHLYSSAFTVERHDIDPATGLPGSFTLTGAGWGHGVGLCQIGAAVMGAKGYSYTDILNHYFVDADIEKKY